MSLIWVESFENVYTFNEASLDNKYDGLSALCDTATGASRWAGERGMNIYAGTGFYLQKNFDDTQTLVIGAAIRIPGSGTPSINNTYPLIELLDAGTRQLAIHVASDYTLQVRNSAGSSLGSTTIPCVGYNVWNYIEIKVVIDNTTGSIEIRHNGNFPAVLKVSGIDTQNTANAFVNQIKLMQPYNSLGCHWDDWYMDDSQFHGECRVKAFSPDADGTTHNEFTASSGQRYECVDDAQVSDGDTDYVYASAEGSRQTFEFTTGDPGTVKGVQVNHYVRKDDVGFKRIRSLLRSNGSDYLGSNRKTLTTSFDYLCDVFENDPDDSNPWNQTKLESREFGIKITQVTTTTSTTTTTTTI